MKSLLCVLIGLLLVANGALLLKQRRVEKSVQSLQAENAQLAQDLAHRPLVPKEQLEQVQNQIERAEAVLRATEQRLANATAMVAMLETTATKLSPGRTAPTGARPPIGNSGGPAPGPEVLSGPEAGYEAPPLVPSSSHTSDGRVQRRSWGPEQVLGPPDTHAAGDIPTAWAPRNSQGAGEEWLHVNYDRSVDVSEVNVRETHNPGAISKVAAVMPDGREMVVWEGTEPPGEPPLNTTFRAPSGVQAQSEKIYLDRARVPGWNEIDAIELVSRDGTRQWASSATASSSYAER